MCLAIHKIMHLDKRTDCRQTGRPGDANEEFFELIFTNVYKMVLDAFRTIRNIRLTKKEI
jgi:hypothetical protein